MLFSILFIQYLTLEAVAGKRYLLSGIYIYNIPTCSVTRVPEQKPHGLGEVIEIRL